MDNNNNNNNIGSAGAGPISSGPMNQAPQPKKSNINKILIIVSILALFAASTFGAFLIGKQNKETAKVAVVVAKPINLPKEAIVLNECIPGRGKQYIEPKNIPAGPIFDVRNSEVIAIEYSLGVNGLLKNPDQFSKTLLALTTDNPVNHFDIVLQRPKAGDTDQMISLIMFVVSKEEAAKITCGTTATTTTTTPASTTTTPASTTTPTTPAATQ